VRLLSLLGGEGDIQMNDPGDYRMDSGGSLKRREVPDNTRHGRYGERTAR
jgi:hypothetical protein